MTFQMVHICISESQIVTQTDNVLHIGVLFL